MDFLLKAKLPFLEEYLTDTQQSILLEAVFWTTLYMIYANVLSRILRRNYRKLPFWLLAKKRGGIFCGNGQDDSILLLIMGIHHAISGTLMAIGTVNNDPIMWRHGLLLEAGFEIGDLIASLFALYPYRLDGIKSDIRIAMIFHHTPGITLSYFIINAGLQANPHMRAIGMWLLLGAAVSSFTGCHLYTLDIDTQMKRVAVVFCLNVGFFLFCRFYEFPKESFLLVQDLRSDPDQDSFLLKLLCTGFILLTLFNLAIAADLLPKTILYIKRARDGVTPIETDPVPRSRDSILGFGRRFSTMMKRTSMINTTYASSKQVERSGSLTQDDADALNETLSSMTGKKTK